MGETGTQAAGIGSEPFALGAYHRGRIQSLHRLYFACLSDAGRGYAFPCDPTGSVDMDALSDRARNNYLYVRGLVGMDYFWPVVQPAMLAEPMNAH